MIKNVEGTYRIYGMLIVKIAKKIVSVKLLTFKHHFWAI
jgi:hypothetical protein